jgi:hypothetical protein
MEAESNSKKGGSSSDKDSYSVTDLSVAVVISAVVGVVVGLVLMRTHSYLTRSESKDVYHKLHQAEPAFASTGYAPPPVETRESEI